MSEKGATCPSQLPKAQVAVVCPTNSPDPEETESTITQENVLTTEKLEPGNA